MTNPIQQEARQILDSLAFTPCDRCHPLSHDFDTIPARVGLYAFRHRIQGLLYIGKANNLRDRLRGGHKAFLWGWVDRYDPDDLTLPVLKQRGFLVLATHLKTSYPCGNT